MMNGAENIDPLIKRLANISEMLVESYSATSDFWVWMDMQTDHSAKLDQFKKSIQDIFNDIPKRLLDDREKYVPEPSFEFGVALYNAKVNNVYLSTLLNQERFSTLKSFLRSNIEFLEQIHGEYSKADRSVLQELKSNKEPILTVFNPIARRPRRPRSHSVRSSSSEPSSSQSNAFPRRLR